MQPTGEAALSIVLQHTTIDALAERDALTARMAELRKMYPIHFLTDADINNPRTGVFTVNVVSGRNYVSYITIVFMGKTADGKYKWKPTHSFHDDWGRGLERDCLGPPEYETDDEDNRLVDEASMSDWCAYLNPCDDQCREFGCCVCGGGGYESGEDSE